MVAIGVWQKLLYVLNGIVCLIGCGIFAGGAVNFAKPGAIAYLPAWVTAPFVAVGAIMFTVAVLGLLGAKAAPDKIGTGKGNCFLIVYVVLVLLMVIAELVAGVFVLSSLGVVNLSNVSLNSRLTQALTW